MHFTIAFPACVLRNTILPTQLSKKQVSMAYNTPNTCALSRRSEQGHNNYIPAPFSNSLGNCYRYPDPNTRTPVRLAVPLKRIFSRVYTRHVNIIAPRHPSYTLRDIRDKR